MKKYDSEKEILEVVRGFETGTISREDWRHAEHLTVALYYLSHHDFETASVKMREGIFNLLKSFGVDLSKEMPYHETLTIIEIRNELTERFDKDYPLRFYSRELLFSEKARAAFVEADLQES
jgi:hypothetical protein